MTSDDDELSAVDRSALERAIALTLAEKDQGRVEQVRWMLSERDWFEVATFCSYHRQVEDLHLLPHESTPSWIDPDEIDAIIARGPGLSNVAYGGARLLRKMLKLGLSQYDPTPLESMAR